MLNIVKIYREQIVFSTMYKLCCFCVKQLTFVFISFWKDILSAKALLINIECRFIRTALSTPKNNTSNLLVKSFPLFPQGLLLEPLIKNMKKG